MKPHEERVIIERDELKEKVDRLVDFMKGMVYSTLPLVERNLLYSQLAYMEGYLITLDRRIKLFPND